jgi:prepilin-type N-terminal cleavage/methylation domain-containing protein
MRQTQKRAAGFTLIELLVVVAIIALLISILLPSLARARELSKRTVCAANIKGIGNGFAAYATGNADDWPIPAHKAPASTDVGVCAASFQYEQSIGYSRGFADRPGGANPKPDAGETFDNDVRMSTTRAFWYMVRSGSASPKSFICPSSEDQANNEDNPQNYWDFGNWDHVAAAQAPYASSRSASGSYPDTTNNNTWAKGWAQCSYGYQVPFGKIGRPNPSVDQDMALVADKGPFGAVLDGGKTAPSELYDGSATAWGTNTKPNSSSSPDDWRKWNSPNHGGLGDGEGQNVMYPDGHADFTMNPLAGAAKDNIYSRWASDNATTYENRVLGNRPGETNGSSITRFAPNGATDTLIYP